MEITKNSFYGFKNKVTGEFKPSYRTGTGTRKICAFKHMTNAEKSLKLQHNRDNYEVAVLCDNVEKL